MDPWRVNQKSGLLTQMHYTEKTILWCITTWRKQLEEPPMQHQLSPFKQEKMEGGGGAWKALTSQYTGQDKWEAEIKCQEQLLHTRVWKGQSTFSLENFISQHRNAFVSMQASAKHVQYQLPNEHSRVGYILEAIQCSDPQLQAAMASIKTDNGLKA